MEESKRTVSLRWSYKLRFQYRDFKGELPESAGLGLSSSGGGPVVRDVSLRGSSGLCRSSLDFLFMFRSPSLRPKGQKRIMLSSQASYDLAICCPQVPVMWNSIAVRLMSVQPQRCSYRRRAAFVLQI